MKRVHHDLDDATLRFNLWLTQVVVIGVALIGSLFVHGWADTLSLFRFPGIGSLIWAIGVAAVVVGSSIGMDRFLPPRWQDDGSINERIFSGLSIGGTFVLCCVIGIGEEWLFRGVVQPVIGNVWTSVLFTLVHVRYLSKPLLVGSVFVTSWLLGWLMETSGSLLPSILAHIVIDLLFAFYIQHGYSRERRNLE